jgi:hypothetical protein
VDGRDEPGHDVEHLAMDYFSMKNCSGIPGWSAEMEEVSAGVYRIVAMTGTDPNDLVDRTKEAAKTMLQSLGRA